MYVCVCMCEKYGTEVNSENDQEREMITPPTKYERR